jgi:gliding motility-associated-like protein
MKRFLSLFVLGSLFFSSHAQTQHEASSLKPQKLDEQSHPNLVYMDANKIFKLPADGAFLYSSLEGATGIISSGYNNNEDYTVTIKNEYQRTISLKSQYFLCDNADRLEIYDGQDINAPLIKVVSGVLEKNFLILSSGEYLTLRFISDNRGVSKGFRFRLDNGPAPQGRPAPPLPNPMACASTPASDECATAPLICDLNGYCGNTSGSYTPGNTSGLGNFCGSIENNSWLSFVASGTSASLAFNSGGCQDNSSGIQAVIYASSNCTSFTEVSNCESQGNGSGSFTITTNVNLVPGQTYYVMIDGFAGNICSYTVSAQAGVALGQQITGPSQVCPGYSATLGSSSTASSYNWTSTPPGTYPNTQTITVTPTVTTTYTLTLGPSACTPTGAIVVKTVTVTNTLNPPNITAPNPICMGSNINLSSLTNGGTYSWTGPAGFTGNTQNVTVNNWSTANNGVYGLTINYGPGCATAPATVNLTGTPSPTINLAIAPSLTVCAGQAITMTASGGTGVNGYTWNWNLLQATGNTQFCISIPFLGTTCNNMPFSIPGMAAGPSATFTPNQNTQICVASENAAGCPGNKCVNIVVLPAAAGLTVSPTATICPGQSTSLTVSGGSTYTWTPAATLSSANGATVTASPTVTTTYTVSSPACSGVQTKTVQVVVSGVPPAIGAISGPTLVCANSTGLTYSVNNVASTNYTWTVPAGASITSGANSNVITVNLGSSAGTVSVVAVASCGTATASINVSLSPALNLTVTPANSNICAGGTVALTASGATNYTWSPSASLSSANGANVTASPTTATTYTVIGATGTCTGSATASISMSGGLTLTVSANTPTVCPGASALLDVTGATSYTWSNAATLSASTGTAVTASPVANTVYTVTGSTGGCTGTATIAISIATVGCIPTSCNLAAIRSALTGAGNVELLGMDNTCSLYFINPQFMSGPQAQAYAQTFGANLISVQSATENADLLQALSNQGYAGQVIWIGFSDALLEGSFVWYDGAPITYSNWAPNEPNNSGGNENCTQIYPDGTWNDLNCNGYNSLSVIEVNLCPQVTITNVPMHCPNTNVVVNASTLLGSPSYTYTWLQSGTEIFTNTSTPGNTNQITVTSTGPNTFTVYSQDRYACPASASITLSVTPSPTITANSSTICLGQQTATLTANGAVNYTWTPSATLSSANGNPVTATPASSTTYTITGSDANGCVSTKTTAVTVVSTPTLIASANATICPAASTTLSVSGASTYTWAPAGSLSTSSGSIVTANPATTTVYSITGTNSNGCTGTTTVQVTVAPNPTITATANATICPGTTTSFTASGGTSYTWTPSASLSSANGAVVTATPAINTTYTVTGANASGCINSNTVSVTIAPNPTLTTSASTTICPAGSSTLTVSGATNYTWSPAASLNTANGATVIASPAGTTTYTVFGANATGCAGITTVTVTVTPNPTITVTSNATVCPNSANSLNASGATSYTWSPNVFLTGSQFSSTVISTPTTSTTYTVTGLTGICSSTATVTLVVSNTVVVNATTATPTICPMSSATLTAGGATNYTWTPALTLNTANGGTVTSTTQSSQTYTVIGATGTCTNSAQVVVTVTVNPTVTVPALTPICNGETTAMTASGASTYSWAPASSLSATTGSTVNANPGSTTVYTVTGSSTLGCKSFTTVTLNVIPIPTISIAPGSFSICEGDNTSLTASGSATGSYTWSASPAGPISGINANPVTVTPTTTTTYTVIGTNGILPKVCPSFQQITINVTPRSKAVAPGPVAICYGLPTIISASGGNRYSWSPPTGLSNANDSVTFANPPSSTVYTVTVSNNGLCPGTATLSLIVNPLPYVYAGQDTTVNIDETITLHGTGNVDVGFLSPTSTPLNCNFCNTIIVNPQESTCYVLMGTNQFNCINTDTVCVTVTRDWDVFIPNAFTPNSDNVNDVFIPVGYGLSEISLTIFNRWGTAIFKSNGETIGWDGSSKGKTCEQGVYIYQAEIVTMAGNKVKRTGHVTLLPKIR